MNEDFVPYELAVKLKEKGFRGLCLAYYTNDDTLYYNYSHKAGASYIDCYLSHNLMPKDSVSGKFVDAPTISQVLKWLREEKKIFVAIDYYPAGYNAMIYTGLSQKDGFCDNEQYIDECDCYNTYELAALTGIEYTLDNLI